jgi:hypothetical protein
MSLPLWAWYTPGLVEVLIQVLDAHEVVMSGSPTGDRAQNLILGADMTSILYRKCQQYYRAPK